VSGDVPACLKPGVQECRRSRRNLSPSDWKYRPNRRVTTYKRPHKHLNQWPRFHENTCLKTSLPRNSQEPWNHPQERDQLKVATTRATITAREIATYKSPPGKKSPRVGQIEIDNLSIVEMISKRRRRRLFVVSIDMTVNLQDMEPATAVPRKPLRIASSAIIVCVESLPAYQ
jgi:hypothetical protein